MSLLGGGGAAEEAACRGRVAAPRVGCSLALSAGGGFAKTAAVPLFPVSLPEPERGPGRAAETSSLRGLETV